MIFAPDGLIKKKMFEAFLLKIKLLFKKNSFKTKKEEE